jgi:hypothetical protein
LQMRYMRVVHIVTGMRPSKGFVILLRRVVFVIYTGLRFPETCAWRRLSGIASIIILRVRAGVSMTSRMDVATLYLAYCNPHHWSLLPHCAHKRCQASEGGIAMGQYMPCRL